MRPILSSLCAAARDFAFNRRANTAMMFGLSLVPMMIAAGAGIDFARGVMVHQRMSEALDAAALAVGNASSKPGSCSADGSSGSSNACYTLRQTAQQYFDMNYDHTKDASYGTPAPVQITIVNQSVTLTSSLPLQLTLLGIAAINAGSPTINAASTVVWGQTKLWVALVLDNSGSMSQGDSGGSKMDALQDAITNSSYGLLQILQNAAATAGDVKVGIVPFTRSVNVGLDSSSHYIDWGEWKSPPQDEDLSGVTDLTGPGDDCPFATSSNGYGCVKQPGSTSSTSSVPSSGTYKGYICPGLDNGRTNTNHNDRYYNGCYTSVATGTTKTVSSCNSYSNCSCSGSRYSQTCKANYYKHAWTANAHSTWSGCVMDRQRKNNSTWVFNGSKGVSRTAAAYDYDELNTQPSNNSSSWDDTQFPAENPASCPAASVTTLSDTWSTLSSQISAMSPNGSTNQAIGVEHGWQMLTTGAPYGTGALPAGTTKVLILFSDGLNTQDRWYGDGSTEGTTQDGYIDTRENAACTAAKADGVTIYAIFIHIGSNGSSTALQNCASDSTKYYDLTASSQIKTAFSDIAQKITNLRVSQ